MGVGSGICCNHVVSTSKNTYNHEGFLMVPVEAMVATVFIVGLLWSFKRKYKQILDAVNPKEGLWYIKMN